MVSESPRESARARLEARIRDLRADLDRRRFGGESPVLKIDAAVGAEEVIARTIAAERSFAAIDVDGQQVSLLEDLASEDLQRAIAALRTWGFAEARALLDSAASRTRDPQLSQRIGMWRWLLDIPRRCVTGEVTEPLRPDPLTTADAAIDAFDGLPFEERRFYRDEVERILGERRFAATDPYRQTVWCILRARLAQAAGEPTLGLAWLLRAYGLNREVLEPHDYLDGLIAQAREWVQRLIDGGPAAPNDETQMIRPFELLNALAARINRVYRQDVIRDAALFTLATYEA